MELINRSPRLVAGICGMVMAQQAFSAGFVEDSKASVLARNFFSNSDNRSGADNPNYTQEWGQGFILDFRSGYTQGLVGFGVDALGMAGFRLDSGKGRHYNPTSSAFNGNVFPTDSDGRAVDEFGSVGLTAKALISKTEFRYGTMVPMLPVVMATDRMLQQTFNGGQVQSKDIDKFTFTLGQLEHVKGRGSSNQMGMSIPGANNARTGEFVNKFYYGGVDYKPTKDLTLQYYYGNLEDFYKQNFLGVKYDMAVGPGTLRSDLRYFDNKSDGANGNDPAFYTNGYYGGGVVKGKVDSRLSSALFTYLVNGHTLAAGFQQVSGDSDAVWLNQGDGSTAYFMTESMIGKFQRAGESTWQVRYGYDFAQVGFPGLTFMGMYESGSNIRTVNGDQKEWERNLTLGYVVQSGPLKKLGVQLRHASLRSEVASQRDSDEHRVIVTYPLDIL
ncbi:OprD family porin [Pseudomonas cichorii]|uniref:OprD family porin n=1 Tax=Pseudomonas lijiangensis TaxID=2995658 RepID=A0ABX8HLU2_9PSED|nr:MULTISPECIES: OprD family porin [Pseudomonas syringae group]MBX8488356.1 OprD family porin [Pseudomonas cichorii]MBX8498375.1 OprD family porin [Pseudomonas lijiangensis]MBX8503282.1 OprD family porin [Pseudomonas lijiangensis]MBX8511732.1 OprD family porin [Pseudomonas cichorii]MBX8526494.1 OprD family porin [Pseudomonas cichorii]